MIFSDDDEGPAESHVADRKWGREGPQMMMMMPPPTPMNTLLLAPTPIMIYGLRVPHPSTHSLPTLRQPLPMIMCTFLFERAPIPPLFSLCLIQVRVFMWNKYLPPSFKGGGGGSLACRPSQYGLCKPILSLSSSGIHLTEMMSHSRQRPEPETREDESNQR